MANLRPSSACKKSLCTRHRHMEMWDMWPRFQVQQQLTMLPPSKHRNGLIEGCLIPAVCDQARTRTVSDETKFQSVTIFRVGQRSSKLLPKYTACLFPNTQDLQIRVVWICGFVSVGSLDSMSGPGRPTATGWPQLCPPPAPSSFLLLRAFFQKPPDMHWLARNPP